MKKKYIFAALCAMALILPLMTMVAQAADPTFGNELIKNRWIEQDRLVGSAGVTRPYTWGPSVPEAPVAIMEPYNSSPGGMRQVQYFDKARMEINNPANGIVTAGLAVKELVSGLRQDGDTKFTQLAPSKTQVAGDAVSVNPNAPVYASFTQVVTLGGIDGRSKPNAVGSSINAFIAKDGTVGTITPPETVTVGAFEGNTGHNIAKPFFDFMNQVGPTTDPITGNTIQNTKIYTNDPTTNVFGLAISEPYWVSTKVAGVDRMVLTQLFERRVLTYNPALTTAKVEMGNLGQHYYQWRYVETQSGGTTTPTTPANGGGSALAYSQLRYPFLGTGTPTGNFNGATGNVNSYKAGPSSNSSPVYDPANKLAIVGTAGSGVVAVDLTDFVNPKKKWSYPDPLTGVNFNSNVILVNGVVYIGGGDNRVYAINELTGALVWKTDAADGPITSDVLVDSTGVYYVSEDGKLYAVNLSDGKMKWTAPVTVSDTVDLITAPIQDTNGILYIGGSDSKIHAFNKDGTVVASFTSNTLDGTISARPSFANGHLYVVTSTGRLYSMNTDGSTLPPHVFTNNTGIYTTPAIATVGSKMIVFVGSDDGLVYGVDANNVSSTQLFAFVVPGAPKIRSSVAVVGNYLYFGTEDKKVYRVEAANQANYLVLTSADETFGTISPVVNGGYLAIASQAGTLYFVK
jgi:outer membrane protein assembly factor BamB